MSAIVRRGSQRWLPSIFNDFFENEWLEPRMGGVAPAINVKETKDSYEIEVAAPGMTKEDFSIHIDENDNLVIMLEKKEEKKSEDSHAHYLRREFFCSKFSQTMILPEDVDRKKVDAKVDKGILEITLPKKADAVKSNPQRKIEVK